MKFSSGQLQAIAEARAELEAALKGIDNLRTSAELKEWAFEVAYRVARKYHALFKQIASQVLEAVGTDGEFVGLERVLWLIEAPDLKLGYGWSAALDELAIFQLAANRD